jgi:fructoselysine-6-P-deglycase FrlB-like protein
LGLGAGLTLPLLAGEETLIASKTYLNSLALVWLISQRLANRSIDGEAEQLKRVRQRLQVMVEAREVLGERWLAIIGAPERMLCVGDGLQAVSARQASLMLAEWAKLSAPAYSLSGFRHGFVELIEPGVTVLVFQSSADVSQSNEDYLHWMQSIGANVIRVRDGFPQRLEEPQQSPAQVEPGLSSILDTAAAQTLAVRLAEHRHTAGFRYLSKVVR